MYRCKKDLCINNCVFSTNDIVKVDIGEHTYKVYCGLRSITLTKTTFNDYFEPILYPFQESDSMEDLNQRKENKLNRIKPTLMIADDYDFEVKIKLKDLINLLK